MFKIFTNNGTDKIPDDDIMYIIGKNGLFLKKKIGIIESVVPVKEISFLEDVSVHAKLHIRKIPAVTFARIVDFFKKVYDEYRSESVVVLMYNEETKKYKIRVPFQKVSAADLSYLRVTPTDGYINMCTIHSHAAFSAFHSGVDDKDEEHFDGLHVTVGNVDEENFSVSSSIVINGHRFRVEPSEYIEGVETDGEIDENRINWSKWTGATDLKRKLRWKVVGVRPSKRKSNPRWMTCVVKEQPPEVKFFSDGFGFADASFYFDGYGGYGEFIANNILDTSLETSLGNTLGEILEAQDKKDKEEANKVIKLPLSNFKYNKSIHTKPPNEIPLLDHKNVKREDINPCDNCVFNKHKLSTQDKNLNTGETDAKS